MAVENPPAVHLEAFLAKGLILNVTFVPVILGHQRKRLDFRFQL